MSVSLNVAVGEPEALTSGAVQVELNPLTQYVAITTGGTAGEELVKLPLPNLPEAGWANNGLAGRRMVVFLQTQTDPADIVSFRNHNDTTNFNIYKPVPLPHSFTEVSLTYVGAAVCFVWVSGDWVIDEDAVNLGFDYIRDTNLVDIFPPSATPGYDAVGVTFSGAARTGGGPGDAGDLSLNGGYIVDGGTGKAGNVNITGGAGDPGVGTGGDVVIRAGTGNTNGQILFDQLPTSDPAVAGALWNNAGTLKISAG